MNVEWLNLRDHWNIVHCTVYKNGALVSVINWTRSWIQKEFICLSLPSMSILTFGQSLTGQHRKHRSHENFPCCSGQCPEVRPQPLRLFHSGHTDGLKGCKALIERRAGEGERESERGWVVSEGGKQMDRVVVLKGTLVWPFFIFLFLSSSLPFLEIFLYHPLAPFLQLPFLEPHPQA